MWIQHCAQFCTLTSVCQSYQWTQSMSWSAAVGNVPWAYSKRPGSSLVGSFCELVLGLVFLKCGRITEDFRFINKSSIPHGSTDNMINQWDDHIYHIFQEGSRVGVQFTGFRQCTREIFLNCCFWCRLKLHKRSCGLTGIVNMWVQLHLRVCFLIVHL